MEDRDLRLGFSDVPLPYPYKTGKLLINRDARDYYLLPCSLSVTPALYDMMYLPYSNISRNTNPGPIQVYRIFTGILPTGLITASFSANSQVIRIWV